jgi:hypothetical protein
MNEESDFEIGGRLKGRRLRAVRPPKTTTVGERVRIDRSERRRHVDGQLGPAETYEDVEIEKQLRAQITAD